MEREMATAGLLGWQLAEPKPSSSNAAAQHAWITINCLHTPDYIHSVTLSNPFGSPNPSALGQRHVVVHERSVIGPHVHMAIRQTNQKPFHTNCIQSG